MSNIYVKMENVPGGSGNTTYNDQIECLGLQHEFNLPVRSGANNQTRIQGHSVHSPLVLYHHVDKASPVLRDMAMSNSTSKTATITVVRNINGTNQVFGTIELAGVKVLRVDLVTLVDQASGEPGGEVLEAFQLHYSQIQWVGKAYDSTGNLTTNNSGGWNITNSATV